MTLPDHAVSGVKLFGLNLAQSVSSLIAGDSPLVRMAPFQLKQGSRK